MSQNRHTLVLNSDWLPISVLPLSVFHWQDAIKSVYVGAVRVLHEYENWVVRSQYEQMRVPSVLITYSHVRLRRYVGFTDENVFLRDNHTCQYCNQRFPSHKLTLDHVTPRSMNGGMGFDNIVAACAPCNNKRGTNVWKRPKREPYRPDYLELAHKIRSYPITVPHASWIDYIGWPRDLITIAPPVSEPGYQPGPPGKPVTLQPEKMVV